MPLRCSFELLTTTGLESAVLARATNTFKIIDGRQTPDWKAAAVSSDGTKNPRDAARKRLREV
jgi:hypothetical protein